MFIQFHKYFGIHFRLAFTAGEEGHMPALLSMVNIDRLTPIPSILIVVSQSF